MIFTRICWNLLENGWAWDWFSFPWTLLKDCSLSALFGCKIFDVKTRQSWEPEKGEELVESCGRRCTWVWKDKDRETDRQTDKQRQRDRQREIENQIKEKNWLNPFFFFFFLKAFLFLILILILVPSPFGAATNFLGRTLMLSQSPFRFTLFKQPLLDFKSLWSYNSPVFGAEA